MDKPFKYDEIREHWYDFLESMDVEDIKEADSSDLHNQAFNQDLFIIGTWKAEQWCGDSAFEVIRTVRDYEKDNFGEISTDLSNPEDVVTVYTYVVGLQVAEEWGKERKYITEVYENYKKEREGSISV